jgi:hypothetical protein
VLEDWYANILRFAMLRGFTTSNGSTGSSQPEASPSPAGKATDYAMAPNRIAFRKKLYRGKMISLLCEHK